MAPVAFPALGAAPSLPDDMLPAATDATAVVDVAPCSAAWDSAEIQASAAYARTYARFADEPGFVDLLVGSDGSEGFVTALFDLDARDAPLPVAPVPLSGLAVRVAGERFQPLFVPLDELDESWFSEEAAAPVIPGVCGTGIRPGARVTTPVGGCTANFIFKDQSSRWYVGTAGHCFGATGQSMSVTGIGPVGTVVYRINNGVGSDFALVRIDTAMEHWIEPAMCHWGGPTSVSTGSSGTVNHYGHGVVHGQATYTRARTGFLGSGGASSFQFYGAVSSGDSGSGAILQSGPGLGVITHVNLGLVVFAHSAPWGYGTRLSHAINLAEANTGLSLELQTAPSS